MDKLCRGRENCFLKGKRIISLHIIITGMRGSESLLTSIGQDFASGGELLAFILKGNACDWLCFKQSRNTKIDLIRGSLEVGL